MTNQKKSSGVLKSRLWGGDVIKRNHWELVTHNACNYHFKSLAQYYQYIDVCLHVMFSFSTNTWCHLFQATRLQKTVHRIEIKWIKISKNVSSVEIIWGWDPLMKGLVILFHVMTQRFGSVMVKNPSFSCEIARYSIVTLITCLYVTSRGLLQLLSQVFFCLFFETPVAVI